MAEKLENRVKYPLAVKWNKFVGDMKAAKKDWEELQKQLDGTSQRELENRYPDYAQKHLGRFRKIAFHWMLPMFVDYYRGAGGLDDMFIILPSVEKKEKGNDSKDQEGR